MDLGDRFWSKVEKTSTCWLWKSAKTKAGYGWFSYGGRMGGPRFAHRLAYEFSKGLIPEGKTLDHLCRVRHCVNPDHLEPVSRGENVLRGVSPSAINARKTHCSKGHDYNEENTKYLRRGNRRCRICHRQSEARRQKLLKSGGVSSAQPS